MHDMASSAHAIKLVIERLNPEDAGVSILQNLFVPVLQHLEGRPTRAIIILVVVSCLFITTSIVICSLNNSKRNRPSSFNIPDFLQAFWSTILTIYLFFANRSAQQSSRKLKRNSRKTRVTFSLLTILLWITALVCSILLVVEYGIFTISVGVEIKVAVLVAKETISVALAAAAMVNETISDILNLISSVSTIGALAIFAVVAIGICAIVELVSCVVACLVSGSKGTSQNTVQPRSIETKNVSYQVDTISASEISNSP